MSLIESMREVRAAKKQELDELLSAPQDEKRNLTVEEDAKFDALVEEIRKADERIDELATIAEREARAAAVRVETGNTGPQTGSPAKVTDPPIYNLRSMTGPSWFKDLHNARQGDREAFDRLQRNNAMQNEKRALGNTGAAGGSGGEFAPPDWLVAEYVKLARPGRVAADLFNKAELPPGVSSIQIPKVSTGTTVAIQSTQNSALSQTDLTTTSISSNIATIGGKQVVAQQLLEQSAIPFDQVILQDLALAAAGAVDVQALTGAGTSGTLRGLASASGLVTQAYTTGAPTVTGTGQMYSQIVQANSTVQTNRFLPADTILMHPRRWAWIASALDTTDRPLVPLSGTAMNPLGDGGDDPVAQGAAGQIAGLQVYVDPNIPTNLGAGTNQDVVYVFRRGDIMLWETSPRAETFTEPYADSMGVLFRLFFYAALVPDRYGSSIVSIGGSGLVPPTF